jgi:hypothetical protein
MGTSKNRPCSSDATKLPANDSVSFAFRFINVHSEAVSGRQRKRFFEVPANDIVQPAVERSPGKGREADVDVNRTSVILLSSEREGHGCHRD